MNETLCPMDFRTVRRGGLFPPAYRGACTG